MLELDKIWHDTIVVNVCLLKNNDGACGTVPIIMSNTSFSTQVVRKGAYLGKAATVNLIHVDAKNSDSIIAEDELLTTKALTYSNEHICWHKQELQRQLLYMPFTVTIHGREEPTV